MAFTKSLLYTPTDYEISIYGRVISHSARIGIIRQLSATGPCTVDEIHHFHPLSLSTVSQHLENLRKPGLVEYEEDFPHIIYQLHEINMERMKRELRAFLDSI